jgi:hypothetical protein
MPASNAFDISTVNVARYEEILSRGLSGGVGSPDGQMCIEAAICATLGLPHGDDPGCVAASVRSFKIALNDATWPSPEARAKGLHDLGLAQLGSKGTVNDVEFSKRVAEKTIRKLIPKLFREIFPTNERCLAAALRCEVEGSADAAADAAAAAYAARAARDVAADAAAAAYAARAARDAAVDAAAAAYAAAAGRAAHHAAYAAYAARAARDARAARAAADAAARAARDARAAADAAYLELSASLALEVLEELGSPGCTLLEED